jgi:hypothetical protein
LSRKRRIDIGEYRSPQHAGQIRSANPPNQDDMQAAPNYNVGSP